MFSTNLFKIDLYKKEILEQIIPAESGGYGGSLAIISPSNADKPDYYCNSGSENIIDIWSNLS